LCCSDVSVGAPTIVSEYKDSPCILCIYTCDFGFFQGFLLYYPKLWLSFARQGEAMLKTRWKKIMIHFPEQLWSTFTEVAETFGRTPELLVVQNQPKVIGFGPRANVHYHLRVAPCRIRIEYGFYGLAHVFSQEQHMTTADLMVKLDWLGVEFLQAFCHHTKSLPRKEDFLKFIVADLAKFFEGKLEEHKEGKL
jgi:hypothetical protein